jgi:sugar O-acyltransferase (sialic acid O-acetyltransferase NeuD family)
MIGANKLIIYGAGGLGREVLTIVQACQVDWVFEGFIDDLYPNGNTKLGILGDHHWLEKKSEPFNIVVAAGNPQIREKMSRNLENFKWLNFPNLIHPDATIGNSKTIRWGKGCIVAAGVRMTTNIIIEDYVLINLNATIGHDCLLRSFASIMPGANISGCVTLQKGVLVGSGANILNGLVLSENCRVGAGSVVTKSIAPDTTVVGIPARPLGAL